MDHGVIILVVYMFIGLVLFEDVLHLNLLLHQLLHLLQFKDCFFLEVFALPLSFVLLLDSLVNHVSFLSKVSDSV